MAFNKAGARQIKNGVITNAHLAVGAAIEESKLVIDWASRGSEILGKKLLIDYVQVAGKSVASGVTSMAVTTSISAPFASADTEKGAVVQAGKNKVVIRDSVTGDPMVNATGNEVYGKLTHNGTDYTLSFFVRDDGGIESAYAFDAAGTIDFQFPQRFDLNTIAETFAANEKFVDGASDVSARLDLEQIVSDAFGAAYTLNHDGTATRTKSIITELQEKTNGTINTEVGASATIDEVIDARGTELSLAARFGTAETRISDSETAIGNLETEVGAARGTFVDVNERLTDIETNISTEITDRGTAVQAVRDDLASIEAGKGASLVGIEDAGLVFTSGTVEGALVELESRVQGVETATASTEVEDARISDVTGTHLTLDARIESGEARFEAVKTEVDAARESAAKATVVENADGTSTTTPKAFASVDARIEEIETEAAADAKFLSDYKSANDERVGAVETNVSDQGTAITGLEGKAHGHFAEDKQVLAGDALINTSRYDLTTGTFVPGDKSLTVYVNGMIQMAGIHYQEQTNASNEGVAISFSPELIMEGDVIQLRWVK